MGDTRRLSLDHKAYLQFMVDLWQKRPDVPGMVKALYGVLLTYENYRTQQCWPCQETLARNLKTSSRSIRRYAKGLMKAELATTEWQRIKGRKRLVYTLYAPLPSDTGETPVRPTAKVVLFPSLTSTGSTPSTTQKGRAQST